MCPNPYMQMIKYAARLNPPPFAHRELLIGLPGGQMPANYVKEIRSVEVSQIVGFTSDGNLGSRYQRGMTFLEVLDCLSGLNLIPESLNYFTDNSIKAHKCIGCTDFPQDNVNYSGKDLAQGGIELIQCGDKYYASNGKQRCIMAMFWIHHQEGPEGLFQNVAVWGPPR